ncbi:hypothetical protein AZE42_13843, partial [Rhizopogon vesiculosus]
MWLHHPSRGSGIPRAAPASLAWLQHPSRGSGIPRAAPASLTWLQHTSRGSSRVPCCSSPAADIKHTMDLYFSLSFSSCTFIPLHGAQHVSSGLGHHFVSPKKPRDKNKTQKIVELPGVTAKRRRLLTQMEQLMNPESKKTTNGAHVE